MFCDRLETRISRVQSEGLPLFLGICRDEPLSQTGKRIQLIKMLCLTVLPILGLWGYTVYTLADSINSREENNKVRKPFMFDLCRGAIV